MLSARSRRKQDMRNCPVCGLVATFQHPYAIQSMLVPHSLLGMQLNIGETMTCAIQSIETVATADNQDF